MCGIGGCVALAGTPDRGALESMARAMAHRGPDDSGVVISGSVGLVHTRLAIVDPAPSGHQPMAYPGGDWLLTYNGEIFNHTELRASLPAHAYRGSSDTESLLHALAVWGEVAIARCNGLFAFAALDNRSRRLLLVRDRLGVKPLYYARHGDALWFASEQRALLAAGVPAAPVPDLVRHAAVHAWINGPQTAIQAIQRVMPGSVISVAVDSGEMSERAWYAPADSVDPERGRMLSKLSRPELRGELERELRKSVRRRLMADVPLGTMCSGGLDSSLITAFARDEQPTIRAYNASIADQPQVDEARWAKLVSESLGVELRTAYTTASSYRELLIGAVLHNEHPLVHESSVPMLQIAELARADGVKVLLSGEGADELFGGYDNLHLRQYADFRARGRLLDRPLREAYRAAQRRGMFPDEPDRRWPAAEKESLHNASVLGRAANAYQHHSRPRRELEASLMGDLSLYLPHLLNRQDKNTMQCSVETRVPFLDPDVVSLVLNLPLETRVEPERKGMLRELGSQHLPTEVARRPKIGFGFEIDDYILPALRGEFLLGGRLRELFPIPTETWRQLITGLRRKPLLLFLTSEIWCRAFLDGDSAEAIDAALWNAAA